MPITQAKMLEVLEIAESTVYRWGELLDMVKFLKKELNTQIRNDEEDPELVRFALKQRLDCLNRLFDFIDEKEPPRAWYATVMKERAHFKQVGRRNDLNRIYKQRKRGKGGAVAGGGKEYLNFDPKNLEEIDYSSEQNEPETPDVKPFTDDELDEMMRKAREKELREQLGPKNTVIKEE